MDATERRGFKFDSIDLIDFSGKIGGRMSFFEATAKDGGRTEVVGYCTDDVNRTHDFYWQCQDDSTTYGVKQNLLGFKKINKTNTLHPIFIRLFIQKFQFNRFVDAKFYKDDKEVKNPVLAFGSLCPGKNFALLQLKWYIVTMINRFDMSLGDRTPEYDYRYHGHEVLPPVNDVTACFTSRKNCIPMELVDVWNSNKN